MMKNRCFLSLFAFLSIFFFFTVFFVSLFISSLIDSDLCFCSDKMAFLGGVRDVPAMAFLGGVRDVPANQNSGEVESLARFAVDEHNKKEIAEFVRVLKAKEQTVAGTLHYLIHHLTMDVVESGEKKLYEAKVWVKTWLNYKELQEYKPAIDAPAMTPSDLGCKKDERESGWREVPGDVPGPSRLTKHVTTNLRA